MSDFFVIDAVAHAYDMRDSNFADPPIARAVVNASWGMASNPPAPEYAISRDVYVDDWSVADTAQMLFAESITSAAVMHPLPIYAFHDGLVSVEKAAEAVNDYPNRFIGAYACVDPLQGEKAIDSLKRQIDLFNPLGVKLYPTSWNGSTVTNWRMDDAKTLYPFYEKVAELGLDVVAIHKAIPTGPIPTDTYGAADVEGAAFAFPHLKFEVVHGGLAFLEETAWLMAGHPNVWLNTEIWNVVLSHRPRAFAKILLELVRIGGMDVINRLVWGTGTMLMHPRPALEAFLEFEFPEDMLEEAYLTAPITQITDDHKRKILGENYARLHGLDFAAMRDAVRGDRFDRDASESLPEPYSTTSKWADMRAPVGIRGV